MIPAWPQPVSTTSPRSATLTTKAWSSRISGSGAQLPSRRASWMGKPRSNVEVRSTSPGDEHRSVEEERRPAVLDDVEARVLECPATGGGQFERISTRDRDPPPGPELRVDEHGQSGGAEPIDQARQPGGVVEVAVAAHDHLDVTRVSAESPQVVHAAVGSEAGVEQQSVDAVALADLHQRREAVFSQRGVDGLAVLERRRVEQRNGAAQRAAQTQPLGGALVDQEYVDGVVAHREHGHLVDRFERQHLAGPVDIGGQELDWGGFRVPALITP